MSNYKDLKEDMEKVESILGINNSISKEDMPDVVTMNVPVLIRLLEVAREEMKDDTDVHFVAEKLIELKNAVITMQQHDEIINSMPSKQAVSSEIEVNPEVELDIEPVIEPAVEPEPMVEPEQSAESNLEI